MAKKPVSYLAGAVFLGTAIGAVVGLFTTPQGEAARRNVRERSQGAFKQWPDKWHELREKGQEAFQALPEKLHLKARQQAEIQEATEAPEPETEPSSAMPEASDSALQPLPPRARPGTGEIW